jgi:alpha-ketoglutarate-dependent taurine dioxygenase
MAGSAGSLRGQAPEWRVLPGKPAMTEVSGLTEITRACEWLSAQSGALRGALDQFGAAYIRGLPIKTVEDFARVRDTLLAQPTPYREKATPRSNLGSGVFSSTDLPASQAIEPHNENSYTLTFPGLVLFGCLVAPAEGGATPVTDCRKVLEALPPHIEKRMRATGWLLTRNYCDYVSTDWKTAFATDDRAEVERYCAEHLVAYEWRPDGNLRTGQLRPGIISHPSTGEEVWFNHMAFWNEWALDEELRQALMDELGPDGLPFATSLGDGEPLAKDELREIQDAYHAASVREAWEPGDLLIVDNILAAHGREAFRGDRKIVVAMGDPVDLADCRPAIAPAATFGHCGGLR